MSAPGGAAAAPVQIRRADTTRPADVRALGAVARATWPTAYRGILPARAVQAHLRRAYAPAALAARPGLDGGRFLLAECGAPRGGPRAVGFCQVARRLAGVDEADLWALYVRPEWQGRGVGRALVEGAADEAVGCRLHVALAEENRRAAAFYARLGFAPEGSGYTAAIQGVTVAMRSMVRPARAR